MFLLSHLPIKSGKGKLSLCPGNMFSASSHPSELRLVIRKASPDLCSTIQVDILCHISMFSPFIMMCQYMHGVVNLRQYFNYRHRHSTA